MVRLGDIKTRFSANQWVPYVNQSGEQIPPYAVLMITGLSTVNNELLLDAEQYDGSTVSWFAVNGPGAVDDGGFGDCTFDPSVVVRYESGTPANGDEWGPTSGNWGIGSGGTGFYIIGERTNTRSLNLVEAVQTRATSVSTTLPDWGIMEGPSQTLTQGAGFTTIDFSEDDHSDGSITADHTTDKITITEDGSYEHHVWLNFEHAGSGVNTTVRVMSNITVGLYTGAAQTATFGSIDLVGHDTLKPHGTCHFTTVLNYSSITSADLTVRAFAFAGLQNIVILDGGYLVRKIKDSEAL